MIWYTVGHSSRRPKSSFKRWLLWFVGRRMPKPAHRDRSPLFSPHRKHLIVQICTVNVKHRLSTPLQRARDWSVHSREGGWSRSTEAGDRSRLTKMLWERSREPGVELKTRGEAPQGRAEDKTGRQTMVHQELKPWGAKTTTHENAELPKNPETQVK